jgi:lipopolysaccharide biosynthesis regulator YciM
MDRKTQNNRTNKKDDFLQIINKLISEQKFGEAINYLQTIVKNDKENTGAKILLKQIKKIAAYRNRDVFSSTNLNMDPWLE